jgi:hypothetical protein
MQPCGIIELEPNRVFLRGPHRHRIFPPTIEQGLEFHDYSAIPVCSMRIMNETASHEAGRAMAAGNPVRPRLVK